MDFAFEDMPEERTPEVKRSLEHDSLIIWDVTLVSRNATVIDNSVLPGSDIAAQTDTKDLH